MSESEQKDGARIGCNPLFSGDLPVDQIICGDNCDVLGTFPRDCIDLVVTSPPYDDLRTYGGHDWDFYGVAWQLKRVLKPGGVIVWVVADQTKDGSETGTSFMQALHFKSLGLRLDDTMIYQKPGTVCVTQCRYYQVFEYMMVLAKGKPKTWNPVQVKTTGHGGTSVGSKKRGTVREMSSSRNEYRNADNVWKVLPGVNGSDAIALNHEAVFPDKLATDLIQSWSNEGDIVCDPFNGSGTTCKMARELGRRYIGIDVNEEYCEIARKRIAQKLLWD